MLNNVKKNHPRKLKLNLEKKKNNGHYSISKSHSQEKSTMENSCFTKGIQVTILSNFSVITKLIII